MLSSLAFRNLSRNRRRSFLTGAAVGFGVLLIFWMLGMNEGAYAQMIDQAVRTRLGHVQILPAGYLDEPEPRLVVPDAERVVGQLQSLPHVEAAAPRAISEGMLARDNENAPVELLGVVPARESAASSVPSKILAGETASRWCRAKMTLAQDVMGGDEGLFGRWCDAAAESRWLEEGEIRSLVLGHRVAERLLVSVGDEVTVQVVRAVAGDGHEVGDLVQRRLEIVGLLRTGNPEVDDRVAYVPLETLTGMLGTDGPNEVVLLLDDIRHLEDVHGAAVSALATQGDAVEVTTWPERNPSLASMIEMDSGHATIVFIILCLLISLGVINATTMSVLERTKEFGVMLALGTRRGRLFSLVMREVALLGGVAVAAGALLGVGLEVFGRLHGWPMEWFGYSENMEDMGFSGVVYDPIYYSALSAGSGVTVVLGVWIMFLLAGLLPALRASRLKPVDAMRAQ